MTIIAQKLSRILLPRLRHHYGFPFITSIALALVTAAWPRVRQSCFHEGTSIWTIAILVTISTIFAVLCGGRFRTFFITVAVVPPALYVLPDFLLSAIRHPEYPVKGFVEYLVYFVAAPIILVWIVATPLHRNKQSV